MTVPEVTPAKRLSLSQIVEMLLTRGTPERSSVTLLRNAAGETQIEVTVKTGDDGGTVTVDEAEMKARDVYERLRTTYPPVNGHDAAEVGLTRNARGETQIAVTVKTTAGSDVATLEQAQEAAAGSFETMRGRFPLSVGPNAGMVAAPSSSGDS